MERYFPERRLFLKSDTDTRFIRLRPSTQLFAYMGASVVVAWAIVATAILLMDSIGSGNFREQAKRDQRTYQERLNAMSAERDIRAEEALAAQQRFNAALTQISNMQSELLASPACGRLLASLAGTTLLSRAVSVRRFRSAPSRALSGSTPCPATAHRRA